MGVGNINCQRREETITVTAIFKQMLSEQMLVLIVEYENFFLTTCLEVLTEVNEFMRKLCTLH